MESRKRRTSMKSRVLPIEALTLFLASAGLFRQE